MLYCLCVETDLTLALDNIPTEKDPIFWPLSHSLSFGAFSLLATVGGSRVGGIGPGGEGHHFSGREHGIVFILWMGHSVMSSSNGTNSTSLHPISSTEKCESTAKETR